MEGMRTPFSAEWQLCPVKACSAQEEKLAIIKEMKGRKEDVKQKDTKYPRGWGTLGRKRGFRFTPSEGAELLQDFVLFAAFRVGSDPPSTLLSRDFSRSTVRGINRPPDFLETTAHAH